MRKLATARFTIRLAAVGAFAWIFATAAHGQSAPIPLPTDATTVTEVVVTGSHIPGSNLTSVSPLASVDSREIKAEGAMRVEDVINRLPQATVDQNATVSNEATGTATVDLRDLGSQRTLVLIDGKRLMPGDPTSGDIAPDLNFIPDALVQRIDIVTGGASAVYGSDAIAGVVNFIMKTDFSGLRMDAETGFYNHVNGDEQVQALLALQGDPLPARVVNDGLTSEVTIVAGVNSPDGKGNLTVYGGYRHTDAIPESSRDFSACALEPTDTGRACSGSLSSPKFSQFFVFDQVTQSAVDLSLVPTAAGDTLQPFDPERDAFNYSPDQYFQRSDNRYTAGVFAHYQLSPAVELYANGMFMDDQTTAQLAPSGLFLAQESISCANPMLSAAEVTSFCTDADVPAGGSATLFIGHRDVGGPGRQDTLGHIDYRVLVGAKGEAGPWRYDVSAQYGAVSLTQSDLHDVSLSRAADALDVVRDASGNLVCASGNPGCVPYDVFATGGVTPAALAYLDAPNAATGSTSETVVSATVSGDLGGYGVKSPWARDGLGVAVGAEYRREGLGYAPDAEIASGDLADNPFSSPAVSGAFDVYELYGEVRAPLARDRGPLLHDLSVEGGYRFSWYSDAGAASTYKAGVEWAPVRDIRLRASFNHAVRAPNVVELFTPQTLAMTGLSIDPCAGPDPEANNTPLATPASCARTGVTADEYGNIAANPVGYNSIEGGNPNLKPETANTRTLGVVFTPRALGELSLSVDYFDIQVSGAIGALGADFTMQECLQTGAPFSCQLIHRAPGTGSLWLGNQGFVVDINQNESSLRTRGVDVDAVYRIALPAWRGVGLGHATINLVGGYVASFVTQPIPGAIPYDCAGYYGPFCGGPLPKWRHTLRTTWNAPWGFDLSLAWRYIAPVKLDATSANPFLAQPFAPVDASLAARSYFDLSVIWRLSRRLELRAGVNNLLDSDPPLVGQESVGLFPVTNANTYPGLYDSLGRFVFAGLTASL